MKTESGIKNGLPWTKDDDEQFVDLPKETQETVKFWITTNLLANNEKGKPYSSYYLKHCLEYATGVYLTNNQYKGAMLSCELFPKNDSFLNWEYMLDKKSKGIDINTQESIGNFNDDFTKLEGNDSEIKQEVNLFFLNGGGFRERTFNTKRYSLKALRAWLCGIQSKCRTVSDERRTVV